VPVENLKSRQGLEEASVNINEIFVEYVQLDEDAIDISTLNFDDYPFVVDEAVDFLPEGAVVIEDPVVQYYDSLAPGEKPKQIYARMSSGPLKCVFPCINDKKDIESILDMGSQIVSMVERVARELQLKWSEDIRIAMQSANGQCEMTLGLARNVPFKFKGLIVYLQVHIL
ncbi:hypothetical protein B0H19DRAFT_913874, partial [Mycena capillaripes]